MSAAGFGCIAIAVVCFGTNFIPVKQFDTGDGMFFQWLMCMGIWISGFFVNIIRDSPKFEPIAMVGGILWCTGNLASVPVINMIGIGLGILLWGSSNLIFGWAQGYFGLFGLNSTDFSNPAMNIIGVVCCVFSMFIMFFIESATKKNDKGNPSLSPTDLEENDLHGRQKLLTEDSTSTHLPPAYISATGHEIHDHEDQQLRSVVSTPPLERDARLNSPPSSSGKLPTSSYIDRMSAPQRRIIGVVWAVISGLFYAVNFTPAQHLKDNGLGSDNGLDYVFSHFSGILLASTAYFLLYAAYSRNHPQISSELVLPAFFSGTIWSFAQISWFVANTELSFAITFPMISVGPGLIAALCGVVFFKEIEGRRNFIVLGAAIGMTLLGVSLVALSK